MFDLQEEVQIMQGARLSGSIAPEQLDTARADNFVSGVLSSKERASRSMKKRASSRILWSSLALSAAAVLALVLWLINFSSRPESSGKETPAILQEKQVIHAASASTDSLASERDSMELSVLEIIQ